MQEILMHFLLILMTFFLLRVLPILESLKHRREIKKMIHTRKKERMLRDLLFKISKLSLFFLVDYFLLHVDSGSDVEIDRNFR